MPIGRQNPVPLRVGARSRTLDLYHALREAMGAGTTPTQPGAGPVGGIEDLWTLAVARAAAAAERKLHAVLRQRYAHVMTLLLPTWERHLRIPAAPTLPERIANMVHAFTFQVDATPPGLQGGLSALDPAWVVEDIPLERQNQSDFGRVFGPLPGAPGTAYSTWINTQRHSTALGNVNNGAYVLHARYLLPAGVTVIPGEAIRAAAKYLAKVLPHEVEFVLYNLASGGGLDGFYLDGGPNDDSLLDQTAL